jgi:hypothetical protein
MLYLVVSCNKKQPQGIAKQITYKDTVLEIDSLNFIDTNGSSTLTEEIAKQTLDDYYAAKGIHDYETDYQDDEGNQLCAYYDTIYRYNLNNDNHEDGIIKYHLMPCFSSGTCFQPTCAIITKISGKYRLISPELLPSYFTVDSITFDKKYNYLYFSKFNCPEPGVVVRYRSKIARN